MSGTYVTQEMREKFAELFEKYAAKIRAGDVDVVSFSRNPVFGATMNVGPGVVVRQQRRDEIEIRLSELDTTAPPSSSGG